MGWQISLPQRNAANLNWANRLLVHSYVLG